MGTDFSYSHKRHLNVLQIYAFFSGLLFYAFLTIPAAAEKPYTFDMDEIKKKPYHFGGYVEFKPVRFGLDNDAAFYKLRLYDDPQGKSMTEWNGRIQLEGSYEKEKFRLYAKTNTDLKYSYSGESEQSVFYEAYGTLKPSSNFKIDAGKKTVKWGKGYAWNPVAFVDRAKDPDDPELAMEGYIMASGDYIKSFDGPLTTFSFTPVLLPVYEHINEDYGNTDKLNVAGRLYFLLYDTDIDLIFMTGGSRPDRFGIDFSRNLTTNFEIHGEYAYLRHVRKTVLTLAGTLVQIENDVQSWLIGLRHLTHFDLTTIVEYYHNGAGYKQDEMENYYHYVHQAYSEYLAAGDASKLNVARRLAEGGYGRFSAAEDYVYIRLIQKEPFDILYFTPALTFMVNINDGSGSITPEVLYTGWIPNLELRLRAGFITGSRQTEFGEKQNDYRIELRAGYYF